MHSRFVLSLIIVCLCTTYSSAQTVRFDTNVGNFDMVLNPDNDMNLQMQLLVDNMLDYVNTNRYDQTVINRAVDGDDSDPSNDFVLQMGSFLIDSIFPPSTSGEFTANSVVRDAPVIVDTNGNGIVDEFTPNPNVRGTVSLALSGGPNTGTSSFFINLRDNSLGNDALDRRGFVPFAEIVDMTTIDLIMQLNNVDVYSQPTNPTLSDIPLIDNGSLVFIEKVRVLDTSTVTSVGASSTVIPEPSSLLLAAGAMLLMASFSRRSLQQTKSGVSR
jgi:peptidyl-prolyl cis-trans isomerase A (cyclophilin A)